MPALAPGQVITLFVAAIGSRIDGPLTAQSTFLPTELGGFRVSLRQAAQTRDLAVPIFSIRPIPTCTSGFSIACQPDNPLVAITVQVPYELQTAPGGSASTPTETLMLVSEASSPVAEFRVLPVADQVHVLNSCTDSALPFSYTQARPGDCGSIVTHADGSLVTSANPAAVDEIVTIYAFGLGRTAESIPAGVPASGAVPLERPLAVAYDYVPNAEPRRGLGDQVSADLISYAGLVPGQVALYQINLRIPEAPAALVSCRPGAIESNLTVTFQGAGSADGASFCVK